MDVAQGEGRSAAMLEQLRGDFEFHERGGEVHVFIK